MGWPRKDDTARIYQERNGAYLLVLTGSGYGYSGYDAIVNVLSYTKGDYPSLGSSGVNRSFLLKCKRVEWSELPQNWKDAFLQRMREWDEKPEEVRGFWKVKRKS